MVAFFFFMLRQVSMELGSPISALGKFVVFPVDRELTPLPEPLVAALNVADVGSLSRVSVLVFLKVLLKRKGRLAGFMFALKLLGIAVYLIVSLQRKLAGEEPLAVSGVALKYFFAHFVNRLVNKFYY